MNRRKILGLFATAPITAPLAAKELVEKSQLAEMGIKAALHNDAGAFPPSGFPYGPASASSDDPYALVSKALKIPGIRDKIKDIILPDLMNVYALDSDIANKRSFSLAAKITFQRQRNIERYLDSLERNNLNGFWPKITDFVRKTMGLTLS